MSRILRLTNDGFLNLMTEAVTELLFEAVATIKEIYEKYYKDIPYKYFQEIIVSDPTYNPQKPDKMGKYSKWLLNLYKKNSLKVEDLYKVKEYLSYFNKYINKIEVKDINKYQTLPDLFNAVEQFINAENQNQQIATSKSDEIRQIKKDIKVVYDDSNWLVLIPLTKEAAIYYGKNTQWCTAAERSNNMFDYYNSKGNLYINIDRRNNRKYQFHFEEEQFMDEKDQEIKEPILQTIGMDIEIARQIYPNNYLTLERGKGLVLGLSNGVYIVNDRYKNESKIVDTSDPDNWITLYEMSLFVGSTMFNKLDNDLFYLKAGYEKNSGIFIDTINKKITPAPEYNIHDVYVRKGDGKRIFYGTYKDGLVTGTVENGRLKGITNFRRTGMFDYIGGNEGDYPWENLDRYLLVSRGQSEDVINFNSRLYDIYDLESCTTVLSEVIYDTILDSDNVGSLKKMPADGQSNPTFEYFARFRKPVYHYEVDDNMYNSGDYDEDDEYPSYDDDPDAYQEYAEEIAISRPFYGVFEDTGDIWEMNNKNNLIRKIS